MASIKAGFYTKLQALGITDNIYMDELPQNPTYPATVFQLISDVVTNHTHDNGVIGFRRARFQIDVFAETVSEAEDAMENYVSALAGFKGTLGHASFTDVSIFDIGQNPDLIGVEEESLLRELETRSRDFYVLY